MENTKIFDRIRQIVLDRCREIEGEKILYPERISDLRLENADLETILDAVDDITSEQETKPAYHFLADANSAMADLLKRL